MLGVEDKVALPKTTRARERAVCPRAYLGHGVDKDHSIRSFQDLELTFCL